MLFSILRRRYDFSRKRQNKKRKIFGENSIFNYFGQILTIITCFFSISTILTYDVLFSVILENKEGATFSSSSLTPFEVQCNQIFNKTLFFVFIVIFSNNVIIVWSLIITIHYKKICKYKKAPFE